MGLKSREGLYVFIVRSCMCAFCFWCYISVAVISLLSVPVQVIACRTIFEMTYTVFGGTLYPTPVFFNFFVAVEPYASVKVTHGTPCIDPWVEWCIRRWSYRVVYGLISIALVRKWVVVKTTNQTKMTNIKFDRISIGSSMLLYLTKHDGRGGRWRPFTPVTNLENLSRGRPRKRQVYVFFP